MTETPLELTKVVRDISVTERNSFKQCRRAWFLTTIENLEPRGVRNWYFDFGTGLHAGLEGYYKTLGGLEVNDFLYEDPLMAALDCFEAWYEGIDASIVASDLGPSEAAFRDEALEYKELGEGMLNNYAIYAPQHDDFEIVCVEGEWTKRGLELLAEHAPDSVPYGVGAHPDRTGARIQVPIVDANGEVLPGRPLLSSRLDLVIYSHKSGLKGFWLYDHKSAASKPSDRALDFDDQVTGYGYNFWRYSGIYIRGVVFNYLIKTLPAEARRVKADKGNPTGLSTAKDQATTPDLYRDALIEDGLMVNGVVASEKHAAAYEALLSRGWSSFFCRFEPTRNVHEYQSFEARLPTEYAQMLEAFEDHEQVVPHLSQYNCGGCTVAPICQAMEDGSDYELVIESRFQQAADRKAQ